MTKQQQLLNALNNAGSMNQAKVTAQHGELTLTCDVNHLLEVLRSLRHELAFQFDQLIDACAVDYLTYGETDWITDRATEQGFSRAVEPSYVPMENSANPSRFAVVYHLLSTPLNHRLRVKAWINDDNLIVPSVMPIWQSAAWFEREIYDLFGIFIDGHPDLRRILTDYGFIGHPFRKDFPVSGHVEMRYDAACQKVIYEAVDIEPRVTVPRVIRHDSRYGAEKEGAHD